MSHQLMGGGMPGLSELMRNVGSKKFPHILLPIKFQMLIGSKTQGFFIGSMGEKLIQCSS